MRGGTNTSGSGEAMQTRNTTQGERYQKSIAWPRFISGPIQPRYLSRCPAIESKLQHRKTISEDALPFLAMRSPSGLAPSTLHPHKPKDAHSDPDQTACDQQITRGLGVAHPRPPVKIGSPSTHSALSMHARSPCIGRSEICRPASAPRAVPAQRDSIGRQIGQAKITMVVIYVSPYPVNQPARA
jgi:hypothetical protein